MKPVVLAAWLEAPAQAVGDTETDTAAAAGASCTSPQTLGFKTLSLLVLPSLEPAPAAVVRGYVTARHNAVLERCAGIEAELADLKALVRPWLCCAGWLSCMSCCQQFRKHSCLALSHWRL